MYFLFISTFTFVPFFLNLLCVSVQLLSNYFLHLFALSSISCLFLYCFPSISVLTAEPSRPHGGPESRVHGEESEQSDDEMLSLSGQSSNASKPSPKPEPPAPTPAAPAEEVDLLGLGGEDINCPCPSSQRTSTAAAATDLLGDLFGAPPQPTSGPSSAQSTPHKVAPNTASPCPSPAPQGETTRSTY